MRRIRISVAALALLVTSCAAPSAGTGSSGMEQAGSRPDRVLTVLMRDEPVDITNALAKRTTLFEPGSLVAETAAIPTDAYYDETLRISAKYPYDLRRTDELMVQAGFVKGADGFYASAGEGRYAPELFGIAEGKDGRETTAVADYWRKGGFDVQLRLAASSAVQNSNELKATYPAWRHNYTFQAETLYGPSIANLQNRWAGRNKIGWVNAEYDRLQDLYTRTLDLNERNRIRAQQFKNINDELPGLPLNYELSVTAYNRDLKGPMEGIKTTVLHVGNLHEWQWIR